MAHHNFSEGPSLTLDEAIAGLSELSEETTTLRMKLRECNVDLLVQIATRFPGLQELVLYSKDFRHPFGDTIVTADDFTTERTMGVSTTKALAITVGRDVGARFATLLSPLQKLQRLSLGISLHGPYGGLGEADQEPELEDVERSMSVVASEQIAQTLTNLQHITWQKVILHGEKGCVLSEDEDDFEGPFELRDLNFVIIRGDDGRSVRVQPVSV